MMKKQLTRKRNETVVDLAVAGMRGNKPAAGYRPNPWAICKGSCRVRPKMRRHSRSRTPWFTCRTKRPLEVRTYITEADGHYRSVRPRLSSDVDYQLWAEFKGHKSKSQIDQLLRQQEAIQLRSED